MGKAIGGGGTTMNRTVDLSFLDRDFGLYVPQWKKLGYSAAMGRSEQRRRYPDEPENETRCTTKKTAV